MTTTNSLIELLAACTAARGLARTAPTAENREAAKAAWNALVAASPKMKTNAYASRAGKRQQQERRAARTVR